MSRHRGKALNDSKFDQGWCAVGQFEWDQLDWDILYLWHGSPSTIGIKRLSSVFIIQQFDKAVR